jgi:hypothetical protein
MHKRRHKITVTPTSVKIDDKEIQVGGLRPVDLLLAALAYGVGIRYIDKTGQPYEMECEVEGYEIRCLAPCTGEEDKCLVYQTTTKGGLKVICRDHGNNPTDHNRQ